VLKKIVLGEYLWRRKPKNIVQGTMEKCGRKISSLVCF
jgi:hypothetical protein